MDILTEVNGELERLKLLDVRFFDASGISYLADFFLIATSESLLQIESSRTRLIRLFEDRSIRLRNPFEEWDGGWCLLDFGNIIIHILLIEKRSFYNLEDIFISSGFREV